MPSFTIIPFLIQFLTSVLSDMWFMVWPNTAVLLQAKGLQTGAGVGTGRRWWKEEHIFGAAWTPKNIHHATRNITDTVPARTVIYISASCMCCLEICISMSQSQFSTRKKQRCHFTREAIFFVFSWYVISPLPPTSGLTADTAQRYESTWDQSLKYPPWGSLQIPQQWVIIQKKEILLYLITQENIIQS